MGRTPRAAAPKPGTLSETGTKKPTDKKQTDKKITRRSTRLTTVSAPATAAPATAASILPPMGDPSGPPTPGILRGATGSDPGLPNLDATAPAAPAAPAPAPAAPTPATPMPLSEEEKQKLEDEAFKKAVEEDNAADAADEARAAAMADDTAAATKKSGMDDFFAPKGQYCEKFKDGKLIRFLAVGDSIHDFSRGYRGDKADLEGKTEATRYLENQTNFELSLYPGGEPTQKILREQMTRVLINQTTITGRKTEIEEALMNFFQSPECGVKWLEPITAFYTTSDLIKKINSETGGNAAAYANKVRKSHFAIEITGDSENPMRSYKDIQSEGWKTDEEINHNKIRDFLIAFLFKDPEADCYLTCDSGPNVVKNIVFNSETVKGLIVPQNISDSAVGTGKDLTNAPDYYLFPTGTDPLLDLPDEPSAKQEFVKVTSTLPNGPLMIEKIPTEGKKEFFQSVANNLTGPYGVTMHYEDDGYTDKNAYAWRQIVTFPGSIGNITLKYDPDTASSGATVNQLLEAQVKTKRATKYDFSVAPYGTAIELTSFLKANPKKDDVFKFVKGDNAEPTVSSKPGLINPTKPHNLYFDIKRSGDQDQCLAVYLARKKLTNVALVTGDQACGIRNRSYDNPTIYQYGQKIHVFRSMFSEEEPSPAQKATVRFQKFEAEAKKYETVIKFYCGDPNVVLDELITKVENIKTDKGASTVFYVEKKKDIIKYIQSFKLKDIELIKDLCSGRAELPKINLEDDFNTIKIMKTNLKTQLELRRTIWAEIKKQINKDIYETEKFIKNGTSAEITFEGQEPFYGYYPQIDKLEIDTIEKIFDLLYTIYKLLALPTSSGQVYVPSEIDEYNSLLRKFCDNFYDAEIGDNLLSTYSIIIAKDADTAKKIRDGGELIEKITDDEMDIIFKIFYEKYKDIVAAPSGDETTSRSRLKKYKDPFVAAMTALRPYIFFPNKFEINLVTELEKDLNGKAITHPLLIGGGENNIIAYKNNIFDQLLKLFYAVSSNVNSILTKNSKLSKKERLTTLLHMITKVNTNNYKVVNLNIEAMGFKDKNFEVNESGRLVENDVIKVVNEEITSIGDIESFDLIKIGLSVKIGERFQNYMKLLTEILKDLQSDITIPNESESKPILEKSEKSVSAAEEAQKALEDFENSMFSVAHTKTMSSRNKINLTPPSLEGFLKVSGTKRNIPVTLARYSEYRTTAITKALEIIGEDKITGQGISYKTKYEELKKAADDADKQANIDETILITAKKANDQAEVDKEIGKAKIAEDLIKEFTTEAGEKSRRSGYINYKDPNSYLRFVYAALSKAIEALRPAGGAGAGATNSKNVFDLQGFGINVIGLELAIAFFNDIITNVAVSYGEFYLPALKDKKIEFYKTPEALFSYLPRLAFILSKTGAELTEPLKKTATLGGARNFAKTYKKTRAGKYTRRRRTN